MERVQIFDTTLRDGEQSPGFSMTVAEKVRMAHQLQSLGVDVIEAGFPIASPGDFEGVRSVAKKSATAKSPPSPAPVNATSIPPSPPSNPPPIRVSTFFSPHRIFI